MHVWVPEGQVSTKSNLKIERQRTIIVHNSLSSGSEDQPLPYPFPQLPSPINTIYSPEKVHEL